MVPRDLVNDCLDVCVTLEDDSSYLVEVTTPEFLNVLMEKSKFLPPGYPYIIVSELTDEIIRAAIQEFIDAEEDSYWLKLYYMVISLDSKDVNEILDRKEKENLQIEAEIDAEMKAEMKAESNINNRVLLETIFFLGLASLISYCFLKPGLFDLFSNFIN